MPSVLHVDVAQPDVAIHAGVLDVCHRHDEDIIDKKGKLVPQQREGRNRHKRMRTETLQSIKLVGELTSMVLKCVLLAL